jgi:cell division protein FtsZ
MTINFTAPIQESQLKPRITVIGVGGAGGNAVNNMMNNQLEGVEFVVANTDAQSLSQSMTERRIQLGINITHGLGAGARPDMGRAAAEEAIDELGEQLQGSHMLFIAAGMGGGTGTGAAPVIARMAREQGMLTVGVVTKPFQFEGANRMRIADAGIEEMQQFVDTLIVIPNQNLFRVANEKTTFADAFAMADDVLHSGVRGVTDLMVVPGLINLDFADIRSVMCEMGKAMMGTGEAEGEDRAKLAAEAAISNPLLDDVSMKGARGVLINITGGLDMTLFEVDEAANRIGDEVDPDANIIFGSALDPEMDGLIRVSVVATGIDADAQTQPRPAIPVYPERALRLVESEAAAAAAAPEPAPMAPPQPTAMAPAAAAESEPAAAEMTAPVPAPDAAHQPEAEAAGTDAEPPPPAASTEGGARDPFLPPPAVDPNRTAGTAKPAADPFREAALINGGPREAEQRGRTSLFKRMTGVGRGRKAAEPVDAAKAPEAPKPVENRDMTAAEPTLGPPAAPKPAPKPAAEPAAEPAAAPEAAAPEQSQLDVVEAGDRRVASQSEEDLLEIPAFLRRQAN